MNYKKKSIILSLFIIFIIQICLLINNKQKSSFRYFIWKVDEVSIGRLICISFLSGLLMSSILNKTLHNNAKTYSNIEDDGITNNENDNSINREDNYESSEIPPERDLRDTQPTISVNYRVIKENGENDIKDRNKSSQNTQYQDDWDKNDSEW